MLLIIFGIIVLLKFVFNIMLFWLRMLSKWFKCWIILFYGVFVFFCLLDCRKVVVKLSLIILFVFVIIDSCWFVRFCVVGVIVCVLEWVVIKGCLVIVVILLNFFLFRCDRLMIIFSVLYFVIKFLFSVVSFVLWFGVDGNVKGILLLKIVGWFYIGFNDCRLSWC